MLSSHTEVDRPHPCLPKCIWLWPLSSAFTSGPFTAIVLNKILYPSGVPFSKAITFCFRSNVSLYSIRGVWVIKITKNYIIPIMKSLKTSIWKNSDDPWLLTPGKAISQVNIAELIESPQGRETGPASVPFLRKKVIKMSFSCVKTTFWCRGCSYYRANNWPSCECF